MGVSSATSPAFAYDALPGTAASAPDPEKIAMERAAKRKVREAKALKKNNECASLLEDVKAAEDGVAFSAAMDKLSLWIIAQGDPLPPEGGPWSDRLQASPLPEGFKTREVAGTL